MSQGRTMIRVEDLVKEYGNHRAVDGISFEVRSGEVLGFLGPNGAGKTTTMKILTCYISPTAGLAQIGEHDVSEQSLKVRQLLGYLPEDTPLYQDLTPLEFLQFASSIRQVEGSRRDRRIREIAEVCGLREVLAQPIGELSKGYRQRVGLAQALIHDPPILILDEPTSGLDPNQIVEIRELIKEIGKQKTVILSTHILPEVQATCGRVIIIHEGKLVADATPQELAHQGAENIYRLLIDPSSGETEATAAGEDPPEIPLTEQIQDKLAAVTGVSRVSRTDDEDGALGFIVGGQEDSDLRRELFRCVRDNHWLLLEMQRKTVSLEDVFRKLTRD